MSRINFASRTLPFFSEVYTLSIYNYGFDNNNNSVVTSNTLIPNINGSIQTKDGRKVNFSEMGSEITDNLLFYCMQSLPLDDFDYSQGKTNPRLLYKDPYSGLTVNYRLVGFLPKINNAFVYELMMERPTDVV